MLAPAFVKNLISAPPSGKLRLASFGADGMAWETLIAIARHPNAMLGCVAEVDSTRLAKVKNGYPDAKTYSDWRHMLATERKNIDIACVATPDHMHAAIAMTAMRMGIPVYVQKPLTHDLYETRKLTEFARKKNLVTQMGIQRHSSSEYQTAAAVIQGGAIGKIKEVHAWSGKKWGDTEPYPNRTDPVPATLDWEQWLGVAPKHPFINGYYHPSEWRKRIDFGTATFGDMGCHIYDPVMTALKLTAPITLRSEGPAPGEHCWALNSIIHYTFPGTQFTDGKTVAITWYDGDERPPKEVQALIGTRRMPLEGSIFIGTDGAILLPHTAMPILLPEDKFKAFKLPTIPPNNHYFQFVDAVLGKAKTSTLFDYSGPLTEAVILGPVATRFPKTTLDWNAAKLKFTNSAEANKYVRRKYRDGWGVKGLS
jgi:predicted dehydrogenase